MGRTGTLWGIEHSGVIPDLVTVGKTLASGMPLAGVVGRAEVMDAVHPGGLGSTYGGNPVACAAAVESIKAISDPAFLAAA
jgi:4-aminobutyrate aminotransferase/(S)-3-amino-2-methylpropionate transaminase